MIELDTFFNNFIPGICLNFVVEKINFVMVNLWKNTEFEIPALTVMFLEHYSDDLKPQSPHNDHAGRVWSQTIIVIIIIIMIY